MNIEKKVEGDETILLLDGRLDVNTSIEFENCVNGVLPNVKILILDLTNLEYISSAGLRVILNCYKSLVAGQKMTIRNPNDAVMDVFEVTGFADIFDIE